MREMGQKPMVQRVVAIVALVQLLAGILAAFTFSPTKPAEAVAETALPTAEPPPVKGGPPIPVPGETEAADAIVPNVPLFETMGATKPFKTLTHPTWEKVPLIFMVLEDKGPWLHVRVNIRPNGKTAWIHRSDVTLRHIANRIVIELGARRLQVLHGNDVLAEHKVAIGAPSGPTPLGEFYVDATVHIRNPNGPYGIGQLSVSGFSDVYHSFGGGIGQIAIHGTNNPRAIGGMVSHGCIRMLNEAWTQVAQLSPNGTPVSIRP